MRIFLTGATGYIGSAVASALARRGHHVLGLARSKEKSLELERIEIEPVIGNLDAPNSYLPAGRIVRRLRFTAPRNTPRATWTSIA
jgi:uncharacterized protein YbjT (DUF2867 family)